MSVTSEKIIEDFRALAPEQQHKLLEVLERETHNSEQARRRTLSRSIRARGAHLGVSSDAFAAKKAEEIALEDRCHVVK